MKHHGTILLAAGLVLGLATAPPAHAFGITGLGGKFGYTAPEDLDGTAAFAGHVELERGGSRVHLLPSVAYWKSDDVRNINPNFDLYYHFSPEGTVTPYVGAGAGVHFLKNTATEADDTDLGLNLFGGLRFPGSASHYFMELRYTVSDVSQLGVMGGLTLHMR